MSDLDERARKMADYLGQYIYDHDDIDDEYILAQLREVENELWKKWQANTSYAHGFNAAKEKAAGIAETIWNHVPQEECFEPSSTLTQREIAERIREMQP